MIGFVNWLFEGLNCYTDELEKFTQKVKEKKCKVIRGEFYCKPLFMFEYTIIDDLEEKFLGEAFYIRLVGCEGDKKVVYTELVELKEPQDEDNLTDEELISLLVERIEDVKGSLHPYSVITKIIKNADSIFEEEEIIPPEKVKEIFYKYKKK